MKKLAWVISVLLTTQYVQAAELTKQCITAPKRIYACENLIYTGIKKADKTALICVCKSDKQAILTLLKKDNVATQRIIIRKLLAKHQISQNELRDILQQIN
jgi:hypothetical protein